ncbi:MAG: hypothetical protein VW274_04565, partial [Thalassolituus sp.]
NEDDGCLWQQSVSSLSYNNWTLSYVSRFHAEYRFPHDLAEGFYYASNDVSLEDEYHTVSTIQAKDYRGYGWEISRQFYFDNNLSLTPKVTWLLIDRIIWGTVKGDIRYTTPEEWGGRLDIEYGYTKDPVLRRPLERPYYGDLYAFGIQADWSYQNYSINYRGENLLAQIYWKDLPYTYAIADTDAAFLIDGYEYYDEADITPSSLHWIIQSYQLSAKNRVHLDTFVSGIQTTFNIGYSRELSTSTVSLAYNPIWHAYSLGFNHKYIAIKVTSDSINTSTSRTLSALFRLNYTF